MFDLIFYTLLLNIIKMIIKSSLEIHTRYSRNQKSQVGVLEKFVNMYGFIIDGMLIYIRCYEEYFY